MGDGANTGIHSIQSNRTEYNTTDRTSRFNFLTFTANGLHSALALPGYLMLEFGVDFYIDTKLGEGGYSTVHRGHPVTDELRERACQQPVAVKVMKGN